MTYYSRESVQRMIVTLICGFVVVLALVVPTVHSIGVKTGSAQTAKVLLGLKDNGP